MDLHSLADKLLIRPTDKLNKRARIDTGSECAYNCFFCYYHDTFRLERGMEAIHKDMICAQSSGMIDIDLSGGESSEHSKWLDIIALGKKYFRNVSTVSNGNKFSDKEFLQESYDTGLREILFSMHGYDSESHDRITGVAGSWKKLRKAIENAQQLGMLVRLNTTLTRQTVSHYAEYGKLLKHINPFEINFLTINPWGNCKAAERAAYNDVCQVAKCVVFHISDACYLNVRFVPFCHMVFYEYAVCDYLQHVYDPYDWNLLYSAQGNEDDEEAASCTDEFDVALINRRNSFVKRIECIKCKYFAICDGVEKTSTEPVQPISGNRIVDCNHYRKDYYTEYEDLMEKLNEDS